MAMGCTTPEGRDPFERMREANVRFLAAGENLALAPTLQIAHTGLMNSPGHRANILQRDFGRVGIGIMDGGVHGLMVTQDFRNQRVFLESNLVYCPRGLGDEILVVPGRMLYAGTN